MAKRRGSPWLSPGTRGPYTNRALRALSHSNCHSGSSGSQSLSFSFSKHNCTPKCTPFRGECTSPARSRGVSSIPVLSNDSRERSVIVAVATNASKSDSSPFHVYDTIDIVNLSRRQHADFVSRAFISGQRRPERKLPSDCYLPTDKFSRNSSSQLAEPNYNEQLRPDSIDGREREQHDEQSERACVRLSGTHYGWNGPHTDAALASVTAPQPICRATTYGACRRQVPEFVE